MAFDVTARINQLIANGTYVEADRVKLESMDPGILEKFPVVEKVPTPIPTPILPVVNQDQTVKQLTWNELVASANPETQGMLSEMNVAWTAEKSRLIDAIVGNVANTFPKEVLMSKQLPELRMIANLASAATAQVAQQNQVPLAQSFFGASTPPPTVNAGVGQTDPTPLPLKKIVYSRS